MGTSTRKELLAALHAAQRIVNESDEFEAANKTERRELEATRAEHEQENARLASVKAAVSEAEAAHQKWREAATREQAKINGIIDRLQGELEALTARVEEKRAEHANIISGLAALTARLKV